MKIQKTNNQPAFTSEVIFTKGLIRTLNRQKTNENRQVLLAIAEALKKENHSQRTYTFGQKVLDVLGLGLGSSPNWEGLGKRLTIKIKDIFNEPENLLKNEVIVVKKGSTAEIRNLSLDDVNKGIRHAKDELHTRKRDKTTKYQKKAETKEIKEAVKAFGKKQKAESEASTPHAGGGHLRA